MLSKFCGGPKATRRRIVVASVLLLLVFLAARIGLSYVPSGYHQLDCINSAENMRRSEHLLEVWTKVAAENNFTWYADYGMLLGAVRNGHLLPWDKDMDAAFMVEDAAKLQALAPALAPHGFGIHGITICYAADIPRMDTDSELIVARLELFPQARLPDGTIVRADLKEAALDHSIRGWLWWRLITWSMTSTIMLVDEVLPLSTVTLKHVRSGADDTSDWRITIPAPRYPALYLERLYGKSWTKEVKWKLTCYM